MDHPWRFTPGGGTDLCPVCTAPHFPFCPLPPLPPHPFPYDLHPPPPPPPPHYHAPFHPPPPPMWAPPGTHPYDLLDMEGPHKRMRVGDAPPPPFDPYAAPNPPMLGRASVEGERLLGLIREHGHGRPQLPPAQWHGEPYPPPDGFGYGGDRGYPHQNYNNPYAQGGNFADYDLVRRMPPPPMPFDRHSAIDSGFVPVGGSREKYFDRDNHHRQFYPDAPPGAPPLPSLPQYADEGNRYDSCDWVLMLVVLCRHHQSPPCLLPQTTMPCHLRQQQVHRCFLFFPVLRLLHHFLLVITPYINPIRCRTQIVTVDPTTTRG